MAKGARGSIARRYRVSKNLYVSVQPSGSRSWVLIAKVNGKQVSRGLGSCDDVPEWDAKCTVKMALWLWRRGLDPDLQGDIKKIRAITKIVVDAVREKLDLEVETANEIHKQTVEALIGGRVERLLGSV